MNGLTQLMVYSLLGKISILQIESSVLFFFMLFIIIANQAALEKTLSLLKALFFSFSINSSFINTFSF